MNDFKKYISDKRRAAETPQNIVNSDGSCNFGTFKSEFPNLDFSAIKKPTRAPQWFTKYKLTRWQAAEVHLKEGILLAAICHMGLFGMILNVFFDNVVLKHGRIFVRLFFGYCFSGGFDFFAGKYGRSQSYAQNYQSHRTDCPSPLNIGFGFFICYVKNGYDYAEKKQQSGFDCHKYDVFQSMLQLKAIGFGFHLKHPV